MNYFKNKRKISSYWWDMEDKNGKYYIIVESDDDRFPVVGKFEYNLMDGNGRILRTGINSNSPLMKEGCAKQAIKKAEKLISDLKAGRISPTKIKILVDFGYLIV